MKHLKGFTLIEVLTTVFIIGILVALTSYVLQSSLSRSRDTQRLSDLNNIKTTLEQYYLENREYPENTLYKSGLVNPNDPWVAKYELERYVLADNACDSSENNSNKVFLAPNYITTIPEDPQYKLLESLNPGSCVITTTPGGNVPGYGQYIYASQINVEGDKANLYHLMARLERNTHVSENLFNIDPARYSLTVQKINNWGYTYCSGKNSTDPSCTHNYYLKNSNND